MVYEEHRRELNLETVADRQRGLLWLILLLILSYPMLVASAAVLPIGALVVYIIQLLIQLAALVQLIRLFSAMKTSVALRVVYAILMFVPFINLLVLLIGSTQATTKLKVAGAKVGLLGVPKSEYPKLRRGHCIGCGYDRSGLELLQTCPECGRIPEVR